MLFHQPSNSGGNYAYNAVFYTSEVWGYHFHRNLELIYVRRGTVHCTVNGKDYSLTAGEMGLCLPCDIHKYEPGADTDYWVLVFSEDYVRSFAKQITGKLGDGFAFRPTPVLERYVVERLVMNDPPSIFTMKSCLYGICEEYLQAVPLVNRDWKDLDPLTQVIDYILAHHTGKITLSDVARRFGYDYNYMSRFFRKNYGMSFGEFLSAYRMQTATALLDDTKKSITDIAYESGFQSVRSFNSIFKQQTGLSPTQYRKRHPDGIHKAARAPTPSASSTKMTTKHDKTSKKRTPSRRSKG